MEQSTWAIIWSCALLAAGSAAVAENTVTAPSLPDPPELPFGGRFFFDSWHCLPAFVILTLLSGGAAWMVPAGGFAWGLVACVPYIAVFAYGTIYDKAVGNNQGLWPVGLLFLVFAIAFPCVAAGVTAHISPR